MPSLSLMFKTVSSDCNLDCSYCYFRETLYGGRGSGSPRHRISTQMLDKLIPEYMAYVADSHVASLSWQGGEPLLAGLPFFERVVALQAAHARPPMTISNSLQTNATLVTDEWAAFFARYSFLIGVSIDGPREIHDALRRYSSGRGSFDRVFEGLGRLRSAGVTVNALCVVGPHNVDRPVELLRFFRGEGFSHVQFIPCMDFQAMEPGKPPAFLITPEEYGRFLRELFDEWYRDGRPAVSIRTFDNLLQSYIGVPNELCVHGDSCEHAIVVEHNGDAYPCDFYADSPWRLGNLLEQPLREVLYSPIRAAFVRQKQPLPAACAACQWLPVCKSGCPRNRVRLEDGLEGPDYFCASYTALFEHADGRLIHLRDRVRARQRYDHRLRLDPRLRPGRNDECPCGSGRKHKACCGDGAERVSYVHQVT